MSSLRDVYIQKPDLLEAAATKFSHQNLRALLPQIQMLKENVGTQKKFYQDQLEQMEIDFDKQRRQHETINKQLAEQLLVANKGYEAVVYQQRNSEAEAHAEKQKLHHQIADLERQLVFARREVEEVVKAPLAEIDRLRAEVAEERRVGVEAEAVVSSLREELRKAADQVEFNEENRKQMRQTLLKQIESLQEEIRVKDEKLENQTEPDRSEVKLKDIELKQVRLELTKEKTSTEELKEVVESLRNEISQFQEERARLHELVTPEEVQARIAVKEKAYENLFADYRALEKRSQAELEEMRMGYDDTVRKLDAQVAVQTGENKKAIAFVDKALKDREQECQQLLQTIADLRDKEARTRETLLREKAEVQETLAIKERAYDHLVEYSRNLELKLENFDEENGDEMKKLRSRIITLEYELKQLEEDLAGKMGEKNAELRKALDAIAALHRELASERQRFDDADTKHRLDLSEKEAGYDRLLGDMNLTLRRLEKKEQEVQRLLGVVKEKDAEIEKLHLTYQNKLADAQKRYDDLMEIKTGLDAEVTRLNEYIEELKAEHQAEIDTLQQRHADHVAELEGIIAERDASLEAKDLQIRDMQREFALMQEQWEEREKDLELEIRERERKIENLIAEYELELDVARTRFKALQDQYEELNERYERDVGPGGALETKKRLDLAFDEIEEFHRREIALNMKVKEAQKKLKDKEIELLDFTREAADIMAIKEKAYDDQSVEMRELKLKIKKLQEDSEGKILDMGRQAKKLQEDHAAQALEWEEEKEKLRKLADSSHLTKEIERLYNDLDGQSAAFEAERLRRDGDARKVQEGIVVLAEENEKYRQEIRDFADLAASLKRQQDELTTLKVKQEMQLERKWQKLLDAAEENRRQREEELTSSYEAKLLENDALQTSQSDQISELTQKVEVDEQAIEHLQSVNGLLQSQVAQLQTDLADEKQARLKQVRAGDKRTRRIIHENDQVKTMLGVEMQKAADACEQIENQFKSLPNPHEEAFFELQSELDTLRQAFQTMNSENEQLRADLDRENKEAAEMRRVLQEQIATGNDAWGEVENLMELNSNGFFSDMASGVLHAKKVATRLRKGVQPPKLPDPPRQLPPQSGSAASAGPASPPKPTAQATRQPASPSGEPSSLPSQHDLAPDVPRSPAKPPAPTAPPAQLPR